MRRGKQILPQQNDLFAHLHHLCLIRLIGQSPKFDFIAELHAREAPVAERHG